MRIEYDLFLMETADKTYKCTRHNFYTKTNKPGTYLARALNSINKSFKPIRLKVSKDNYTSNPIKTVHKFKTHLASLYKINPKF